MPARIAIALLSASAVVTGLVAYLPPLWQDAAAAEAKAANPRPAAPREVREPDAAAAGAGAQRAAPSRAREGAPPTATVPGEAPSAATADGLNTAPSAPEPPVRAAAAPRDRDEAPVLAATQVAERAPGSSSKLHFVGAKIRGSLYATLARRLPRSVADPLTAVVGRVLVWWVLPHRDLRRGDEIAVLYELPDGEEPRVHAVVFHSTLRGRTFRAYRFQPAGAPFARLYDAGGREIERRLTDTPIRDYEQITSLLYDGRGHQGVDFKAPIGTPVYAPFDGRIARVDWRTRRNGRCLHLHGNTFDALFLHLSRMAPGIRPGRRVKKGDLIAYSGNTGHSTAPHLHYQLMKGRQVVDPFTVQATYRAALEGEALEAFEVERRRLDAELRAEAEALEVPLSMPLAP